MPKERLLPQVLYQDGKNSTDFATPAQKLRKAPIDHFQTMERSGKRNVGNGYYEQRRSDVTHGKVASQRLGMESLADCAMSALRGPSMDDKGDKNA
jgi:hypothetical protein